MTAPEREGQAALPSDLICPFCGERDFDRTGLKAHLSLGWCDAFNQTSALTFGTTERSIRPQTVEKE